MNYAEQLQDLKSRHVELVERLGELERQAREEHLQYIADRDELIRGQKTGDVSIVIPPRVPPMGGTRVRIMQTQSLIDGLNDEIAKLERLENTPERISEHAIRDQLGVISGIHRQLKELDETRAEVEAVKLTATAERIETLKSERADLLAQAVLGASDAVEARIVAIDAEVETLADQLANEEKTAERRTDTLRGLNKRRSELEAELAQANKALESLRVDFLRCQMAAAKQKAQVALDVALKTCRELEAIDDLARPRGAGTVSIDWPQSHREYGAIVAVREELRQRWRGLL